LERKDGYIKKLSSTLFYKTFSYFTGQTIDKSVGNFGNYSRNVVKAILSMGDSIRCFSVMVQWIGFKKFYLPVEHAKRGEDESSYTWLLRLTKLGRSII
jgi:hypothetical protein